MPGFVFKLEAVLEQRLNVERHRQCELAEVQREMVTLRDQIAESEKAARDACALQRGQVDVRVLASSARFAATMRQKAAFLRERLQLALEAEARAQSKLVAAAKDRKVMEKLREKLEAKWVEEEKKKEELSREEATRAAR